MKDFFHLVNIMRRHDDINKEHKRIILLSEDHLERIEKHVGTVRIQYLDYKKAFDYVDDLFPEALVKESIVLRASSSFLNRLGYKGIGGFYNRVCKKVVVPDKLIFSIAKNKSIWNSIKAKISEDEVIVHELLHYASDSRGTASRSANAEEEFAYGNSIGYLKSKGHTDEYIITKNFLPFLVGTINIKKILWKKLQEAGYDPEKLSCMSYQKKNSIYAKVEKKVFEETKEKAIKLGQEIIDIYTSDGSLLTNVPVGNSKKKFSMLDI